VVAVQLLVLVEGAFVSLGSLTWDGYYGANGQDLFQDSFLKSSLTVQNLTAECQPSDIYMVKGTNSNTHKDESRSLCCHKETM